MLKIWICLQFFFMEDMALSDDFIENSWLDIIYVFVFDVSEASHD